MSFSNEVKKELSTKQTSSDCCALACCYAIAMFGKYFDKQGVILHTEKVFVAQFAKTMYEKIDIPSKIYVKGSEQKPIYEFAVKSEQLATKLLKLTGHTGNEPAFKINFNLLQKECCQKAFLSSAFLCVGTITNPVKDYNLEFICNKKTRMKNLSELLQNCNFSLSLATRKNADILYTKSSAQIEDILVYMGATNSAYEVMNNKIVKEIRNQANRTTNCETANIKKTIQANIQAINAIEYLKQNDDLMALPKPLILAAQLRLEYDDLSLAELCLKFPEPISKSGLSHRLKKIEKIAEQLKQNRNE